MKKNTSELILIEPYGSCERQMCVCSPKDVPIRKHKHKNGRACGNFRQADYGCWKIYVGKTPERTCEADCWCSCHSIETEQSGAWNEDWVNNVEKLKLKWRNN